MSTPQQPAARGRRAAAIERVVRSGEVDLAVYEHGDPTLPTVLCAHGWPDCHQLWDEVVPLLSGSAHVVTFDARGTGASTRPKGWRAYGLSSYAEDLRAVADAVSPGRAVHLLGHDWGGVAAWEAVCEPGAEQWFASLTSASGPNLDHMSAWVRRRLSRPTPRNVAAVLGQLRSSLYIGFFLTPVLPKLAFRLGFSQTRWQWFISRVEGTPAHNIHLGPTLRRDAITGLRTYRANVLQGMRRRRERYTQIPVQIIASTRDVAIRPACYADEARWVGQLWRRDIAAGHWSPFSHPQVLATAVTELIEALDGGTPARALRRAEVAASRPEFAAALVVITGAGSGIGRQSALAFARQGADVVICDVDLAAAKQTATLVAELGVASASYEVDVSDEAQMRRFADAVLGEHGVPDVLVNNAGIGHAGRFLDTTSADFQHVLDVNLNGVVYGCRAFAPAMVARGSGGHIVNLSSMAAYAPQQVMGPYSTSKAAVFMFSDCLRAELASAGIGVSTICPGIVHTNIVATTRFSGLSAEAESAQQARFDRIYARRNYPPERVAEHIVAAVRERRAVVPVTAEAYQAYYLSRLAPALSRRLARLRLF